MPSNTTGKRTPGLWVTSANGWHIYAQYVTSKNDPPRCAGYVATVAHNKNERTPESAANARFIVQAVNCHDELLAALKNLLSVYRANYNEGDMTPAIRMAEAAIAKAGREEK